MYYYSLPGVGSPHVGCAWISSGRNLKLILLFVCVVVPISLNVSSSSCLPPSAAIARDGLSTFAGSSTQRRRFFRTDPLLYHKFENMVICRLGTCTLCSSENQDYQKIIHFFNFFSAKKIKIDNVTILFLLVEIDNEKVVFLLKKKIICW